MKNTCKWKITQKDSEGIVYHVECIDKKWFIEHDDLQSDCIHCKKKVMVIK